ncbi:MAG TPA: endonuclease [Vicinamibacteria bacterium]|nr:endonuclease [Vicinamibacteria bacterium]
MPASRRIGSALRDVYRRLRRAHGPAGWWPAASPFEVCLGAVLVQNTAWSNVERALAGLRARGLLSYEGLAPLAAEDLAPLRRPSGCFNVKARRLRAFLDFLGREHGGRAEGMAGGDPWALRERLLAVPGIGRETADSIVLYAAGLPLFVIDAYTRRVFARLGLVRGDEPYDELQRVFMSALPADTALFNDYHAQVVVLAKDTCRVRPRCAACPLAGTCPQRGVARRDERAVDARSILASTRRPEA